MADDRDSTSPPLRTSVIRYDDPFAPVFPESPEVVRIDAAEIVDWDSFHSVSVKSFGLPEFYGRNLDAWIDCLSDLRLDTRMTRFRLEAGQVLLIELVGAADLRRRLPDVFEGLIDAITTVNQRFREEGTGPALALMPL